MANRSACFFLAAIRLCFVFGIAGTPLHADDLQTQIRHEYENKALLVRGFYSGEWLLYNSSGKLIKYETPGDWTADGFVRIAHVQLSGTRLLIDANRLLVVMKNKRFEFQPAELIDGGNNRKPAVVRLEVDFETSYPTDEQLDAALSRIFLTQKDSLAFLVPPYWHSCVLMGLLGKDYVCQFSSEIYSVLGVAVTAQSLIDTTSSADAPSTRASIAENQAAEERRFHIGNGVTPPKALHSPEPGFSEAARAIRYTGVLTLGLVVDKEGVPRAIRILSPLGAGLDEKAVHAVEGWRFQPAQKDGQPVPVEIAIEVDFHLY